MTYPEIRERFFAEVNGHPENIDLIAHNCAAALFQAEVPQTTIEATLLELNRRWEFAAAKKKTPSKGELG